MLSIWEYAQFEDDCEDAPSFILALKLPATKSYYIMSNYEEKL